jgi:hypothetical protein
MKDILVNKNLRQHLIMHGCWYAFQRNVTNNGFTRFTDACMQMVKAFDWEKSPEGGEFWRNIYYQLCES